MDAMTNEHLAYLAAEGDISARDTLWERTQGLFRHIANSLYCRYKDRATACGVEYDDCCSICWFSFLDSVRDYAKLRGREEKFTSFIRLHVKRHIFALLGMRASKREPLDYAASLDAPLPALEGDVEVTIADTIADPTAEQPFEDVDNAGLAAYVLECITVLPEREQEIIRRHYWESTTFKQIAADKGLTPQRLHEIYSKALKKLKKDARLQEVYSEFYSTYNFTKRTGFTAFREDGMSAVEAALLKIEESLERLNATRGGVAHGKGEG